MNATAGVALAVTIGFALGDWWSKARDDRRLEYLCKPATLVALIVVAVALDPAAGAGDRRAWFVAALVFSLAGDVFLMLPRRVRSRAGAFLVAHVCYVIGFWTDPPGGVALLLALVVVVVAVAPMRDSRPARSTTNLPAPARCVYMVVISAMVASAIASGTSSLRPARCSSPDPTASSRGIASYARSPGRQS